MCDPEIVVSNLDDTIGADLTLISDSTRLSVVHLSPLGSQLSFNNVTRIENVVDWEIIAKKYRALMRDEPEESISKENEADTADEESEIVPNNVSAAP